jgi:hypothetical protein
VDASSFGPSRANRDNVLDRRSTNVLYLLLLNIDRVWGKSNLSRRLPGERRRMRLFTSRFDVINVVATYWRSREIMEWVTEALKKYAVFSGRSRRKEYWYFVLFTVLISIALSIIDSLTGTYNISTGIGFLGRYLRPCDADSEYCRIS